MSRNKGANSTTSTSSGSASGRMWPVSSGLFSKARLGESQVRCDRAAAERIRESGKEKKKNPKLLVLWYVYKQKQTRARPGQTVKVSTDQEVDSARPREISSTPQQRSDKSHSRASQCEETLSSATQCATVLLFICAHFVWVWGGVQFRRAAAVRCMSIYD